MRLAPIFDKIGGGQTVDQLQGPLTKNAIFLN